MSEPPEPSDLLGAREVADLLGVERGTITTYLARKQMPEPYVRLACGPIWLRSTIEHWSQFERGRTTR